MRQLAASAGSGPIIPLKVCVQTIKSVVKLSHCEKRLVRLILLAQVTPGPRSWCLVEIHQQTDFRLESDHFSKASLARHEVYGGCAAVAVVRSSQDD